MNINLHNGKTINSFLAARESETRKQQISKLNLYVQERIRIKKDLKFIKYWGASNKKEVDKYDLEALLLLFGFLRIVEKTYRVDTHLTIIFTDTHAILNGYYSEFYYTYYQDIRKILNDYNYNHILMSEILKSSLKTNEPSDVESYINSIIIHDSIEYTENGSLNGDDSFEVLKKSASKHSLRYNKGHLFDKFKFNSPDQAAYAYILLNQVEKQLIEKRFSQSFFLSYTSGTENEMISPKLPSLQIFSYRTGIRSRPWFSFYDHNKAR